MSRLAVSEVVTGILSNAPRVRGNVRGKFALIEQHNLALQGIKKLMEQTLDFVVGMVRANGYHDTFSTPEFPKTERFGLQVAELDESLLGAELENRRVEELRGAKQWLRGALDELVEANLFGRIVWSQCDPTVCEYSYYSHRVESRTRPGEVTKSHLRALHLHTLIEARSVPFEESRVWMPKKYRQVLQACPAEMRRAVHVVEGQLIKQEVREGEYRREVQIIRPKADPAIVLDNQYVLGGWDDSVTDSK